MTKSPCVKRKKKLKKDFQKLIPCSLFSISLFFVLKSIAFIDKDHVSESMSFGRQARIQYYVDDEPIV